MFKRLVQLFLLLLLAVVGVLVWFAWYVSTPLLVPVGGDEPSASPVADSLVMEPVEAVSADGTAIEGYLVRPGRPEALSPRQSRVRSRLHVPGMESAREKRRPEILHVRIEGICGRNGSAGRRIPETGGIAARGRRRAGVWGSGAAESRV